MTKNALTTTNAPVPAAPANTFIPAISFTGYPDGKTETAFEAGVESQPVPVAFLNLVRAKGLIAGSAVQE